MNVNSVFGLDIRYLYETARELGGTIRDVANVGGLFQAVDYIELKLDPTLSGPILTEDEVYRTIDDGSRNLWTEDCEFIGNGENEGWAVQTPFGEELVKPDLFVVEQAVRTYYMERCIREEKNPRFFIERINYEDEKVMENISGLVAEVLPKNWLMAFMHGELPPSYATLAYQMCYLRYYYPEIFQRIWSEDYCPEYKYQEPMMEGGGEGCLGVAIGELRSTIAYYNKKEQKIRRLWGEPFYGEKPDNLKVYHQGAGRLENAGVACSKIGVILENAMALQGMASDAEMTKVNACFIGNLPDADNIAKKMRLIEKTDLPGRNIGLFSFEELELGGVDGAGILKRAAELAKLPEFTLIEDPLMPVAKYYSTKEKSDLGKSDLEEQEKALIFYLDEHGFMTGILQKIQGELKVVQKSKYNIGVVAEFNIMLYKKMLELIQPRLDIFNISKEDPDVLEVRKQVGKIKRQFIRNDKAIVNFNNGWLSLSEEMPLSVYEECLFELVRDCDGILQEMAAGTESGEADVEAQMEIAGIRKLFLAGDMADGPVLWKLLEEEWHFGGKKELVICGEPGSVTASGLCLL